MGTLEAVPAPRVVPEALVQEVVSWLFATSVSFALGLALGELSARLMRRGQLHWSWAALIGATLMLLRSSLGGIVPPLGLAAGWAAVRGRRWHREDIEAGGDLGSLAADRRRPTDALRRLAEAAPTHLLGFSRPIHKQEIVVGRDRRRRTVAVPFAAGGGGTHALVLGATGSGKTVTQTLLAVRSIERGAGAIVIDPKGDLAMRERLACAAASAGRTFLEWHPNGDCVYNPYCRGGETEIADKVLAAERFSEPHYLRQAQRYLGHVVRALRATEREVSLARVVEHLDAGRLELLARALPGAHAGAVQEYLDSLTARQLSDLSGVRDRLAILIESDVGPLLDPQTEGCDRVDLLDAVHEGAVVYFGLESDSRPLLSQMLGAAIVQDLQTIVASLQGRPIPTLVLIDEFSAVAAEQVVRLFGRARSAGFSLLLGTQELADLRPPGGERLLEQVMGNLSVVIAHRQVVPSSAELIAGLAGTTGAWHVSRHSDGRTTRTRQREAVLDPGEVMNLPTGWAAAIVLGRAGSTRITHISAPVRSN